MKKALLIFTFLLLTIFSTHITVNAAEQWFRVRSKNFNLIGNASDKDIRRVATKLEQFREVFTRIFPNLNFNSPVPTTVIVFKSGKSFKPYKPLDAAGKTNDWVAGYFQSSEDINYITLSTEGEKQQTYATIFHEYVHFLVSNNIGDGKIPAWFNEGIAEYYDQFSIEDDQKVTLGGLNANHLNSLQRSKLIPFETFFNIDNYSLRQQGNHSVNIFYAQSWALIHYLMQGNDSKRNPQLVSFLNLLASGKPPRDAFQQAFQSDYATMEKELKKYVEQNTYRVSVASFEKKLLFENEMQTTPLSESEAKANLGDLLYHSNRLTEAESHLNESLALDANSALANTSLGLVKMRRQKFSEAKAHLEKAVAGDQKNYMVHYQYAYILSREGMSESNFISGYSDESTKKMRDSLNQSIALKPDFAESYRLLAFLNIVRNENIDDGIKAMSKALQLAPGNQSYQLNLADLYIRKNDFDKALSIIDNVVKTAGEPQLRAHAEASQRNLQNIKNQFEEAKKNGYLEEGLENGKPRLIVRMSEKLPTQEELDKLQAEAEYDGIYSALRKVNTNEKRVSGHLSKIQCAGGNIIYSFKSNGEVLKFQSKDFQGLHLMAFIPLADFQVGCDTISKDFYALLTYLPSQNAKANTLGEVVAIELIPEKFKLKEEK